MEKRIKHIIPGKTKNVVHIMSINCGMEKIVKRGNAPGKLIRMNLSKLVEASFTLRITKGTRDEKHINP